MTEPLSDERLAEIRATEWVPFNGIEARSVIDGLLSRLDKAEAGWQDISTAPKDGTYILVTNADAGGSWVAKYNGERAFIENPWMSMMLNTWHLPARYHSFKPTHWRPLPPPPSSES